MRTVIARAGGVVLLLLICGGVWHINNGMLLWPEKVAHEAHFREADITDAEKALRLAKTLGLQGDIIWTDEQRTALSTPKAISIEKMNAWLKGLMKEGVIPESLLIHPAEKSGYVIIMSIGFN